MKPQQGLLPGNAKCPRCGGGADGYTKTQMSTPPRTGDITLCAYCAHIGVYEVKDGIYSVRSPTKQEIEIFYKEIPDLHIKVQKIKQFVLNEQMKKN